MPLPLDLIFPPGSLSQVEEDILADHYSNPVVQKHLRLMALEDTKELLGLPYRSMSDSDLAKASATIQGKLSVISTLLGVTKS